MLLPSEWRAKAIEYAIKAYEITDVDLRRQYTELAARSLDIANKRADIGITAATRAGRPYATSDDSM